MKLRQQGLIACRLQRCGTTQKFPLHFGKQTFPGGRRETRTTRGADWTRVDGRCVTWVVKEEGRAGGLGGERTTALEAQLYLWLLGVGLGDVVEGGRGMFCGHCGS